MGGCMKRVSLLGLWAVIGALAMPVCAPAATPEGYDFVEGRTMTAVTAAAGDAAELGMTAGAISFRFYTWGGPVSESAADGLPAGLVAVDPEGHPVIIGGDAVALPQPPAAMAAVAGIACALLVCGARRMEFLQALARNFSHSRAKEKAGRFAGAHRYHAV